MRAANRQPTAVRALSRIGLWGAPSSGKTTFLAALSIAVNRSASEDLMIWGVDGPSTDFLVENTARLTRGHFPEATRDPKELHWVLQTTTRVPARRFGLPTTATVPVEFNLDMLDEPGGAFADTPEAESAVGSDRSAELFGDDDPLASSVAVADDQDALMDQLAGCDALLLLFDPTKEWEDGDAFNYFHGTLLKIAQRRMADRTRRGTRLPHYVAVCTTKFDHPDVYRRAKNTGYRSYSPDDPYLFPRVPDELAEDFFSELVLESERGNADLVRNALRRFFVQDRVRFFVTSAIGFHLNRKVGRFMEREYSNVDTPLEGQPRIKGPIYPINVVEPLMWLGQSLVAGR